MARVAMPIAAGFEDSEYSVPFDRLTNAGHQVITFGSKSGETVEGKRHESKATVERTAQEMYPGDFDAMVIPGGHAPDSLRLDPDVVSFVRGFCETGKPVAAVCHGPQLLIEANVVAGKTMTSWPSIKTDLENAGAVWIDEPVVEDDYLITSRKPDDLEAFSSALLKRL